MTRIWALAFVLLCSAASATPWQPLQERLQAPLTRGAFSQEKQIAGLPLPLHSSGVYQLVDGLLVWQTFASELRIGASQVAQWEDGAVIWQVEAQAQPLVATLARLMLALVVVDTRELDALFTVQRLDLVQAQCWSADFRPKDPMLAGYVSLVHAAGCAQLHTLEFEETSGDKTRIQLSEAQ
jgi:hypothetical protein